MDETADKLLSAARECREHAFAPFSGFRVGAAVEAEDGTIFAGCNVESASYGLTMCAERVAIFSAVAAGRKRIKRISVVAESDELTAPCGACRQVIWEFGGDIPVLIMNTNGELVERQMSDLLPMAFDSSFLK
ncbi:MAG TPA: cytidine deaminase [Pyrinomonadaceae bacterium]|nr:cytidine deaminase [Pyrinomonadaceae bacterium]